MTISLVTGADRGIGQEVAIQLGALGHHVLVGSRDPDKAAPTVDAVAAAGSSATDVPLDIADRLVTWHR